MGQVLFGNWMSWYVWWFGGDVKWDKEIERQGLGDEGMRNEILIVITKRFRGK